MSEDNQQILQKKCLQCGLKKDLREFFKESNNKSDGRRGKCKQCDKISRPRNKSRANYLSRKKYSLMTKEQKTEHIRKKSIQNKERFLKDSSAKERRKEYNKSDRGIYTRYKNDANRRYRSYIFDLTFDYFSTLINQSCHYCGINPSRGVDRIVNNIGYTVENSVSCCSRCNEMKNDDNVQSWINHMKKIIAYCGDTV